MYIHFILGSNVHYAYTFYSITFVFAYIIFSMEKCHRNKFIIISKLYLSEQDLHLIIQIAYFCQELYSEWLSYLHC